MRLTLRTMLAYLDEVLDPADAELLGKKIQESEFASNLVHRIRNSTRRLRLDAPKLEGKGMGLDPNTVAEYLDSALSPDRVPDFEKVCLESDVHLAEVAACHQVLTLVLGEPANVETSLRERIYRLGSTGDDTVQQGAEPDARQPAAVGAAAAANVDAANVDAAYVDAAHTAGATADEAKATPAKPEVPDYLRAGRGQRLWPLAATPALAFLLAGLAVWYFNPFGVKEQVADKEKNKSTPKQPADDTDGNNGKNDSTIPENTIPEKSNTDDTDLKGVVPPPTPPPTPPMPDPLPKGALPKVPGDNTGVPSDPPLPGVDPVKRLEDKLPKPIPGDAPLPKPVDDADAKKNPSPAAVYAGRYISNRQVVARFDTETKRWLRLPNNSQLVHGDRLLSFPTYRPQIALASGIQLTLDDATELTLESSGITDDEAADEAAEGKAAERLHVSYGRVLLVTNGKANSRIELNLGGRLGVVRFVNADSALALEVRQYRSPGSNPEKTQSQTIVQLFATSGQIQWHEEGEIVSMNAGQVRTFVDDAAGHIEGEQALPQWIRSKRLEKIELRASQSLEPKLDEELPLTLSLMERVSEESERHVEVRSLAIICLSYLDHHEPFVEALGDETYKSYWTDQLAAARAALARGPNSAAQVRIALEKRRDDDAPELYRLLWGYSPADLEKGAGGELVARLESESLDFRVLASFGNLEQITGRLLMYRPERTASRNRVSVQTWKKRLESGAIVYTTPPSPLPATKKTSPPTTKESTKRP